MGASLQKLQDLEEAILLGDTTEVANLLKSGISVNAMLGQRTALYFAIEKDKTSIADLLLARGASVRHGYFTETPIHCAAVNGNTHIASKLLERGAKVNTRNHNGSTPLWLAASEGHSDMVLLLLQQPGVDVDCPCGDAFLKSVARSSALCQAVRVQNLGICKALLLHGASINMADINGCTPLHHACRLGNAAITIELIKHGCALNCVDKHGYTPLHTAVNHDRCFLVEVLIHAGCDINRPCLGEWDFTPLHTAAKRGNAVIVSTLCAASGIRLNSMDRYSMTPIVLACKHGSALCWQRLLDSDPENSPLNVLAPHTLCIAVCSEKDPHIRLGLQRLGVEYEEGGGGGWTAAMENIFEGEDDMEYASFRLSTGSSSFQVKGSNLSLEDNVLCVVRTLGTGQQTDHVDVLHFLLKAGADMQVKDDFRKTAIESAIKLCGFQCVLLLLCHGATISEDVLNTFLASNYLKPRPIFDAFALPVTVALMWTATRYRHIICCHYNKLPFQQYQQLPQPIKTALCTPMALAQSCRGVVRDMLTQNTSCSIVPLVEQLPVPRAVKQFLLLSDILLMVADLQRGTNDDER